MNKRVIAIGLGAAALAVPSTAVAGPGHGKAHGKAHKPHNVAFVFRGTFVAPDTVTVTSGNAHVRKAGFVGQSVTFDLSGAKIVAADTNGDQAVDLNDVKAGDRVLVQARLPKGTAFAPPAEDATATALSARRLVDQSAPPVDEDSAQ